MRRALLTILGAAALTASNVGTTQAAGFTHGNLCVTGAFGGNAIMVANQDFGISNSSTANTLTVVCSLPDSGTNITKIDVFAFDRNTGQNFDFRLTGYNSAGFAVSAHFTGIGPGGPGTGMQTGSATLPANTGRMWTLQVTLPPAFVSGGTTHFSHFIGARLGT